METRSLTPVKHGKPLSAKESYAHSGNSAEVQFSCFMGQTVLGVPSEEGRLAGEQ